MPDVAPKRIDTHVHVGVLGDDPAFEKYGAISPRMRRQVVYRIMLLYARIGAERVSDQVLRDAALEAIAGSGLDHVVCLALDPVYDPAGNRREDLSNMWVDNDYILDQLAPAAGGKVLLGASVHPYDPQFRARVARYVAAGAVLLKWLPSAQQIDLADPRVGGALEFLATAGRGGRPLPLLLHVGPEYSIMTTDPRTWSYDFLSWSFWDRLGNLFRGRRRWQVPDVEAIDASLRRGLHAGACVIFAHCGLPYFAPRLLGFLEHSDFEAVKGYLERYPGIDGPRGKCLADVSACVTPFRRSFFPDIRRLPGGSLLAGSDFPVPVFELSADIRENLRDFAAMVKRGELERIVVPQDNLLAVNWRELQHAFGEHPMFRNAADLLLSP